MTGLCTTNGFMLGLKGVPDYNYVNGVRHARNLRSQFVISSLQLLAV